MAARITALVILASAACVAALAILSAVTSAEEPAEGGGDTGRRVVVLLWQSVETPEAVWLTWTLEPVHLRTPEPEELWPLEFLDYDQEYRRAQLRLLCPSPAWVPDDVRATDVLSIWQSVEVPEALWFSWGDGDRHPLVFADWPGPYRLAPTYVFVTCPTDWGPAPPDVGDTGRGLIASLPDSFARGEGLHGWLVGLGTPNWIARMVCQLILGGLLC